jgi:hypothetical protein
VAVPGGREKGLAELAHKFGADAVGTLVAVMRSPEQ